jgi:hypothetical protein
MISGYSPGQFRNISRVRNLLVPFYQHSGEIPGLIVGLIGGFVCGAIWAFIYNVAAGVVRAIEVELDVKA